MTIHNDSVWPWVQPHAWKHMQRSAPITGILWHCTRGGQWYDGDTELGAYINWVRSPNNRVPYAGGDYAGIASYGIGPGRIVECVPDDRIPRYSSWPSDRTKLSVEVAQSNPGQPIEAATIAECARFARWASETYGFPLTRVWPANDDDWTGMSGHEDTVQGKASGKSDPGPEFWVPFMAALEEEPMSEADRRRLDRLEKLLAGNGIAKDLSKPDELTFGEDALAYAAERGWSAFLGLGLNQTRAGEAHTRIDNHTHSTTPAPEEPRVRTIKGTIEGTISE